MEKINKFENVNMCDEFEECNTDYGIAWNRTNNKCGMKFVDYDDMLYLQCVYKFEKTISPDTYEALQKQAKENLETVYNAHPRVAAHWQSIVDEKVPFGYTVKED